MGNMKKVAVSLLMVIGVGATFAADYKPLAENTLVKIKTVTTTTAALTAGESGQIVYVSGTNSTITLPSAAAGLQYFIVRGSATAAHDVVITAGAADKINGSADAGSITNDVDGVGLMVHVIAVDSVNWVVSGSSTDF